MNAVARMLVLDLRTVAPYRNQLLILLGACTVVLSGNRPIVIVPALVLLITSQVAAYPFLVGDKAGLQTLYAVLPLPRRAVLRGHYAWAVASFTATVALGTALTFVLAWAKSEPIGGETFATALTLSWAIFVVNVTIQFPLFVRFGYSRISLLSTFLPLAVLMLAVTRLHLTIVSLTSLRPWLPVIWPAGAAAIAASVVAATTADRHATAGPGGRRQTDGRR